MTTPVTPFGIGVGGGQSSFIHVYFTMKDSTNLLVNYENVSPLQILLAADWLREYALRELFPDGMKVVKSE